MLVNLPATLLFDLIESVKPINSECIVIIEPEQVSVTVVDEAKVAIVQSIVPRSLCSALEVEEPVKFGILIGKVLDMISGYEGTATISGEDAVITFADSAHRLLYRAVDPSTMDKVPTVPAITYNSFVTVNGKNMYNEVMTASKTTTFTKLQNYPSLEKCMISTIEGQDTYIADFTSARNYSGEDADVMISAEYLKDIMKILKDIADINLLLKTDTPVKIKATTPEGLQILYMIAPRIEQ